MSRNVDNITITEWGADRDRLMPLLLVGDESEKMVMRYLHRGRVFAAICGTRPIAVCVITEEPGGIIEIKNLAVHSSMRRKGIGRAMLAHAEEQYPGHTFMLGTGETPSTLRFYRSCGYRYSHRIANFFTDNYERPIVEEGVTLRDMLYLTKRSSRPFSSPEIR